MDLNKNIDAKRSTVNSLFEEIQNDVQKRKEFLQKMRKVSGLKDLREQYNTTTAVITEIFVRLQQEKTLIPSMRKMIEVERNNDVMSVKVNGTEEKTSNGFIFEGEKLKAEEVNKQMCETVVSYYKQDKGLFEVETDTSAINEQLRANNSTLMSLSSTADEYNISKKTEFVDSLHASVRVMKSGKVSPITTKIIDTAPPLFKPTFIKSDKKAAVVPRSYATPRINDPKLFIKMMTKLSRKSSYAEIANKHLYGTDFGGEAKYIEFLLDIRYLMKDVEVDKFVIHSKDSMYALAVSNYYPDWHVYFIGQARVIRHGRLEAVSPYAINNLEGVHIIMEKTGNTVRKEQDLFEVYRTGDDDVRRYCEKLKGICFRLTKVFSVHPGCTYYPSTSVRNNNVWEISGNDEDGYSDKEIIKIVALAIFHWYSYPWVRKPLFGIDDYYANPEGTFSLRMDKTDIVGLALSMGDTQDEINAYLRLYESESEGDDDTVSDASSDESDNDDGFVAVTAESKQRESAGSLRKKKKNNEKDEVPETTSEYGGLQFEFS